VIKPEQASRSVAHLDHSGVLGEDGDGPEGPNHDKVAPATLEPGMEKTTARGQATVCEAVHVGLGAARQPSGAGDVVTLARGTSMLVAARDGAKRR
jgi:hypothetical protein